MDSNKPDQPDNKPFIDIWGRNETRLSALIAQTILLSPNFRRFIAGELNIENKSFKITYIKTEHAFDKNEDKKNQIDILIKCQDGLLIGIENKIWAFPQGDDQLIRYDKSLNEASKGRYRLVFLTPSTYKSGILKPEKLKELFYKDIYRWIDSNSFESVFETDYVKQLRLYLDALNLEIRPFTRQEINDLKERDHKAINKLKWIISSIKPETANLNHSANSGYSLYGLDVCGFPVYVGFRYSSYTNWFSKELLQSQPECLIYIQDNWNDDEFNRRIGQVYNLLKHQAEQPHDRKKIRECRLSIRKSLLDFEGKDISEIVQWFEENFNLIKKAIEEVICNNSQNTPR